MIVGTGSGCVCGGLLAGGPVAGMDVAALDAEIAVLARVDAMVVARRSLVVAELLRQRSDAGERLRGSGGMSSREAKRASRTAEGLEKLPKAREALGKGEISPGQAEQLASRANDPDRAKDVRAHEEELVERARHQSTDEFGRGLRRRDLEASPDDGNTRAQKQRQCREGSMWVDTETGMHCLFARFDPVTGARVSTRLQAMVDAIWRAENGPRVRTKRRVAQRRADALEALICQTTTSTNTGSWAPVGRTAPTGGTAPAGRTAPTGTAQQQGFGFGDPVACAPDPVSGSSPAPEPTPDPAHAHAPGASPETDPAAPTDRTAPVPVPPPPANTQMMVIANFDVLRGQITGGTLADGTPMPVDTITRLGCDAELLPAFFNTTGQPLWLGRTQRLATPAQRAAVTARDHGCIVCHTAPEYCQVHHVDWWSNHGNTDLDNLCLLCSNHHHAVHERGLTITRSPDGMKVQPPGRTRSVQPVPDPPDPPAGPGDPEAARPPAGPPAGPPVPPGATNAPDPPRLFDPGQHRNHRQTTGPPAPKPAAHDAA